MANITELPGMMYEYAMKGYGLATDAVGAALDYIDPRNNDDNTLSQSKYDFTYKAFPNDLGMDYLGHYMVININVPVWPGTSDPRGSSTITSQFNVLPGEYSKVDVLRYGKVNSGDAATGGGNSVPRRTRRIVQSVALFMPGTQMIFLGANDYQNVSMVSTAGKLLSGIVSWGADLIATGITKTPMAGDVAKNVAGGVMDGLGNVIQSGAAAAGTPINPCVEVLFTTTALREFQFDFVMVPRNEKEAETIQEIVKTLRFHSAPEVVRGGFTFVPPAEFDITFYHRGVENMHIPRINTCVLTEVEADYSAETNSWQTYRTGHPVATRLRLMFREVEMVHKLRVLQGF